MTLNWSTNGTAQIISLFKVINFKYKRAPNREMEGEDGDGGMLIILHAIVIYDH